MSYNFIGLVNAVNSRVNEVELTTSNFDAAIGHYTNVKDAVNASIRRINQDKFMWPFNYTLMEDTLVAGLSRYAAPTNAKHIDYNTFRIKRNDTLGNTTVKLFNMDYEQYLERYIDNEYNSSTAIRSVPRYIVRAPGNEFVFHPVPDKAYEVVYEYYALPVDLILATDVPTLPPSFKHLIVDGALYYVYAFRSDIENADRAWERFDAGLKDMRSIYINRYEYARDTRVNGSDGPIAERIG